MRRYRPSKPLLRPGSSDSRCSALGARNAAATVEGWTSNWSASDALADIGHSSRFVFVLRSAEFLGESDEKPFRPTDVAEPIRVFILDYFAYELRAARAEPFKRLVDVVHGEHDAEIAQRVDRGVPVICDDGRREEVRELEPAVAVRCAHHSNLDTLIAQSSDPS